MAERVKRIWSDTYHEAIDLICSGLKRGETVRDVCPKCGGGDTREKCFVATRESGSLCYYKCFRAKCGFSGRNVMALKYHDESQPRARARREFSFSVEPLSYSDLDVFRQVYGINPDRHTFWCPELGRYAHRVFGPDGQHRGWQCRDYMGMENGPKAISYPFANGTEPFISWQVPNRNVPTSDVVVVEDILSAKKVADSGFAAVALLGTHIDTETAYEIAEVQDEGTVHLALDEGTVDLMMKHRDRFGAVWGDRVQIWVLKKDLKYVSRERIRKAIHERAFNFRTDAEVTK